MSLLVYLVCLDLVYIRLVVYIYIYIARPELSKPIATLFMRCAWCLLLDYIYTTMMAVVVTVIIQATLRNRKLLEETNTE